MRRRFRNSRSAGDSNGRCWRPVSAADHPLYLLIHRTIQAARASSSVFDWTPVPLSLSFALFSQSARPRADSPRQCAPRTAPKCSTFTEPSFCYIRRETAERTFKIADLPIASRQRAVANTSCCTTRCGLSARCLFGRSDVR